LVAYAPPDRVILTVGASFRTEPLLKAGNRFVPLVHRDLKALVEVTISREIEQELAFEISDLTTLWKDPRAKKHDTPLPMNEVQELLARARAWMRTLRAIALVNLSLDSPALARVSSPEPELVQGYARDLVADLELRIEAARDVKPRLEEIGLTDAFLGRGRTLLRQLKTAIGAEDPDAANLHFTVRRLYVRKGTLYMMLKRVAHAGRLVHLEDPRRAGEYHLEEIEPLLIEPLKSKK
jgi:hypothetical protein